MKKINLIFIVFLVIAVNATALDLNIDFHKKYLQAKAERLFRDRKYKEAEAFYVKLAAAVENENEKLLVAAKTALTHGRLAGKYDEAVSMSKEIKNKAFAQYVLLDIMSFNKKHKELVATAKDEKFESWPEVIKYKGFLLRADAYKKTGRTMDCLDTY